MKFTDVIKRIVEKRYVKFITKGENRGQQTVEDNSKLRLNIFIGSGGGSLVSMRWQI
jgi:hypothetical protein